MGKRKDLKKLEEKVRVYIKKAEEFIDSDPCNKGLRYLNLANMVYAQIPPNKKGKETEIELFIKNLNFRYTNK